MEENRFQKKNFFAAGVRDLIGYALKPHLFRTPFYSGGKLPKLPHIIDELNDGSVVKSDAVSIVKIKDGNISKAVEEAIDLLGGMAKITEGKQRIMLKPNMISHSPDTTTNPAVVEPLIVLMQAAGKEVCIGEGTATAKGYNRIEGEDYRTKSKTMLKDMQQSVFDTLGYTQLSEKYGVDLINLHLGETQTVSVPDGMVFKELVLNKAVLDVDMLCSVPMLKTHGLAVVTLGMKNLFGIIPGSVYGSVRGRVHDMALEVEESGTNCVIMDLVRTVPPGLVVIDGSVGMEGDGPLSGIPVKMDLIIAGTNPLATDMIGSIIMGFDPYRIPTFQMACSLGFSPAKISAIEVRGEKVESVWRRFIRPRVFGYRLVGRRWGFKDLDAGDGPPN